MIIYTLNSSLATFMNHAPTPSKTPGILNKVDKIYAISIDISFVYFKYRKL